MYKVYNKSESSKLIKTLKLNEFPKVILNKFSHEILEDFISKYPANYYAVRDMSKANSKLFNLAVKKNNLLDYCKHMEQFYINVSSYNYNRNQLCVGEIKIDTNYNLSLTISTNQDFSARDAVKFPDYNMVTDIYDKRLNKISGLNQIIEYIFKHNLFNLIIEFSCFDKKVGINNENIIIYELRTEY